MITQAHLGIIMALDVMLGWKGLANCFCLMRIQYPLGFMLAFEFKVVLGWIWDTDVSAETGLLPLVQLFSRNPHNQPH
jgi:hypothetical protein